LEAREISQKTPGPNLHDLAERLEKLSFSPEQKAWLRDLVACLGGNESLSASPPGEAYGVFICSNCGEQFFFKREAYGPEDHLLCPECGEAYPLPPEEERKG